MQSKPQRVMQILSQAKKLAQEYRRINLVVASK
jgi:hypothetical protein